jgi:hypothetical protein
MQRALDPGKDTIMQIGKAFFEELGIQNEESRDAAPENEESDTLSA